MPKLTPSQLRAARALLNWSRSHLAKLSGISEPTLHRFENGENEPKAKTAEQLFKIFDQFGVEFTENRGVSFKDDRIQELEGPDCYVKLLDEIYHELKSGDEFLVAWANEKLAIPAVHDSYRRILKKGIRYRKLIKQDSTFIYGPLLWYRYVPSNYHEDSAAIFFNDKSAYATNNTSKVVIIRDERLSIANKKFFELVWRSSSAPTTSTITDRYQVPSKRD